MKSRNLYRVAKRIENIQKRNVGFNMGPIYLNSGRVYSDQSGHECGTVACIAGHAYLEAGHTRAQLKRALDAGDSVWDAARDFLGLTPHQAQLLFAPPLAAREVGLENIPQSAAVETLRRAARTHEIDWRV